MYQTKMLKTGATFSCQKHKLNCIYEKASYKPITLIKWFWVKRYQQIKGASLLGQIF